jgi:hypothetical protein
MILLSSPSPFFSLTLSLLSNHHHLHSFRYPPFSFVLWPNKKKEKRSSHFSPFSLIFLPPPIFLWPQSHKIHCHLYHYPQRHSYWSMLSLLDNVDWHNRVRNQLIRGWIKDLSGKNNKKGTYKVSIATKYAALGGWVLMKQTCCA